MLIGFFNYFEMGCGIRVLVRTAETIEEIKQNIDDYYLLGLEYMELTTLINAINDPSLSTNETKEVLMTLEHYCPVAYENLIKYNHIDIDFQYAINLS